MIGAGEEAEQARATRGGAHVLQDMGTILRERREAMGISLAEAEAATRIRQKYVSALENNEWAVLPGEVVGRGFLRNYSSYLGLDTTEMMERRRAAADPRLAASLANISVGATLPPERAIDYRPMNVDIKDEPDAIQGRNLRLRPILTALAAIAVVLLLGWGVVNWGDEVVQAVAGLPERLAQRAAVTDEFVPVEPRATAIVPVATGDSAPRPSGPMAGRLQSSDGQGVGESSDAAGAAAAAVASERSADAAAGDGDSDSSAGGDAGESDPAAVSVEDAGETVDEDANTGDGAGSEETAVDGETVDEDANTGDGAGGEETAADGEADAGVTDAAEGVPTESPGEQGGEQVAEPAATPTFTALPPTATFTPDPPTATPEPPTPEPAPVVAAAPAAAAACADPGTQIFSPGVNQAVAGTVEITGVATSPIFQEYKLEWAPAGTGSFNWFTGASVPVESGVLGYFDSAAVPPQAIDLRLTVVDNTGNFQTPCTVTINVQN